MEATHHALNRAFDFTDKDKRTAFILIGIGLLGTILGFFIHSGETTRVWANLLLNAYYFAGISVIGLFFIAVNSIGYGGWFAALKRVAEAQGLFVPVAAIGMLLVVAGTFLHFHHIYHWAHPGIADEDPIIAGKMAYFQPLFYFARFVAYFAIYTAFAIAFRRASLNEDLNAGLASYKRNMLLGALFLVSFAVFSSASSWDFIMSIDTHWYSTLFGWYNFASYFVAGIATMILLIIFLKSRGYLEVVNDSHLHDLGKFMFAFSVFWTYLWFSQFMLIWYANVPEETVYFFTRVNEFGFLFYLNLIINFVFPFLVLMTRNSKRQRLTLAFVAIVLLCGHWLDFYLMIMPGAVGEHAGIGIVELAMPALFVGLFIFVVLTNLSKASLLPVNHPFIKESMHHHI